MALEGCALVAGCAEGYLFRAQRVRAQEVPTLSREALFFFLQRRLIAHLQQQQAHTPPSEQPLLQGYLFFLQDREWYETLFSPSYPSLRAALQAEQSKWRAYAQHSSGLADFTFVIDALLQAHDGEIYRQSSQQPLLLVAAQCTPTLLWAFDPSTIVGLITEECTDSSHTLLIASGRNIPVLGGVTVPKSWEGQWGYLSETTLQLTPVQKKSTSLHVPYTPASDCRLSLAAYTALSAPLDHPYTIDLFRTEMEILACQRFLSEEEQYTLYRSIALQKNCQQVTFRLYDFGGDKQLPGQQERGAAWLLQEQEQCTVQVRALLRLHREKPLRLLLPYLCSWDAYAKLVARIEHIAQALAVPMPQVGAMVETVALLEDSSVHRCPFLSIGGNDLLSDLSGQPRTALHVTPMLYKQLEQVLVPFLAKQRVATAYCGLVHDQQHYACLRSAGIHHLVVDENTYRYWKK